jgi:hypothetical protein
MSFLKKILGKIGQPKETEAVHVAFVNEIMKTGLFSEKEKALFLETVESLKGYGESPDLSKYIHNVSKMLILAYINNEIDDLDLSDINNEIDDLDLSDINNEIDDLDLSDINNEIHDLDLCNINNHIEDDIFFKKVIRFLSSDKKNESESEKENEKKRNKILEILQIDKKSILGYQKEKVWESVFNELESFSWILLCFVFGYVSQTGVLFSGMTSLAIPGMTWMHQNTPLITFDKAGMPIIQESPIERIESIESTFRLS